MKIKLKIISVCALFLASVMLFSGCGLVDFARSVLKKDEPTTQAPADTTVTNTNTVTGSVIVSAPPSTQASTAPSASVPLTQPSTATDQSTEAPSTEPATEASGELSVQEIQRMLFATEDPTAAAKVLTLAGFAYDAEQDIYYTQLHPWQRYFGFNVIYDIAAPRTGMIYDTKRIIFEYGDKEWMVQIWKGQYGITAGGEVGFYNRPIGRALQYDCVTDEEMLTVSMDFYNMGEKVFTRGPEKHWWLTGFKIFNAGVPMLIDLDINIDFEDSEMADAFLYALRDVCKNSSQLDPMTYKRSGDSFNIKW